MGTDNNEIGDAERRTRFVELLNESQSRLFGFLYAHVLNMADAEDLNQQVAMVLWTKFDQFEPGTDFGAWAMRVADFTIKNFLRGKRRSKVCFSDEVMQRIVDHHVTTPAEQVARRNVALRGCLQKIKPDDRSLLEKCYGTSASIKEIARGEGRSAGAVYTALNRIRRALLACIQRSTGAEATV
ncbi:ECF RNA polymerase sigma factor SigE [Botrimarina colliarenosi]|uniref:ECF RNA polymerase sigma factor SigE n=1 Tax=Botrimarina colliarenosi TaxID=2528001 RepID=A0A5C6AC61_9BACT|nr:sigma-70 family RNA polymerase sigma factor [Botrimarina colliarenosi]TWT97632.1 ECF RNA polymerase sigma factor SigE [Botrimarina colliarenosi]